jgi:hypothetical protein
MVVPLITILPLVMVLMLDYVPCRNGIYPMAPGEAEETRIGTAVAYGLMSTTSKKMNHGIPEVPVSQFK